MLFDCTWIYLLTLARAAEYVRRTKTSQVYNTLREYFLGGQIEIREKEARLSATRRLSPHLDTNLTPEYFDPLAETFARLFVRQRSIVDGMRYCEVAIASLIWGRRPSILTAFGEDYDVVSAKLLLDVIQYLASSAKLSPSFRVLAREMIMDPSKEVREPKNEQDRIDLPLDSSAASPADGEALPEVGDVAASSSDDNSATKEPVDGADGVSELTQPELIVIHPSVEEVEAADPKGL